MLSPVIILLIGMAVVVGAVALLRLNAFLALIGAADRMNDSGFWVFSKMVGVPEIQTLKSWAPVSAVVGTTAMATTVILMLLVPLR